MPFCHYMFFDYLYVPFIKMEDKIIDESRQGEAVVLQKPANLNGKKLFLESYGCAMNFSDSEIVASILKDKGFKVKRVGG